MKRLLIAAVLLMSSLAHGRDTGFITRTLKLNRTEYKYQVYIPADFDKHKKWPVILFLHGVGERGSDGLLPATVGIGKALREHPERWPFVVVMPQCRKDRYWTDGPMEEMALGTLHAALKDFHGDTQRVYLAGLSMGGYGVWQMALRRGWQGMEGLIEHAEWDEVPSRANYGESPAEFAAFVVICGGISAPPKFPDLQINWRRHRHRYPYDMVAAHVADTPVWIFHGESDPVVPVEESRKMVAALKQVGASVRYTEYPKVGHNSWDLAFDNEELPQWLLQQKLPAVRKR